MEVLRNASTKEDLTKLGKADYTQQSNSSKTFNVTTGTGSAVAGLTLDWNLGFALYDTQARKYSWQYKFSQLRGSSDDGKSRLKLHFQDLETKAIETKELECQSLQGLLFCMHAFLTAKVASVDPAFLSSRTP